MCYLIWILSIAGTLVFIGLQFGSLEKRIKALEQGWRGDFHDEERER